MSARERLDCGIQHQVEEEVDISGRVLDSSVDKVLRTKDIWKHPRRSHRFESSGDWRAT